MEEWYPDCDCKDLLFTMRGIYNVLRTIKKYAKSSSNVEGEVQYEEYIHDDPFFDEVCITVSLKDKLNKSLNEIFGTYDEEAESVNWIHYFFRRSQKGKRYRYLKVGGRHLCGERYNQYIEDKNMQGQCPCPVEYKKICQDITSIFKRFALPKK